MDDVGPSAPTTTASAASAAGASSRARRRRRRGRGGGGGLASSRSGEAAVAAGRAARRKEPNMAAGGSEEEQDLATSRLRAADIDDVSASVARHRPAHGHTRSRARCCPRSARLQLPCSAHRCELRATATAATAPPLCGHPNEEDHSCQRGATQRCLPVTLHNVIVTPTVAARRRGCARAHSPRADLLHADLPRSAELPPPARADQPSTHRQRCGGRASCASRC